MPSNPSSQWARKPKVPLGLQVALIFAGSAALTFYPVWRKVFLSGDDIDGVPLSGGGQGGATLARTHKNPWVRPHEYDPELDKE